MNERNTHYVKIGNAVWAKSPDVLYCKGLGSCVAVCLYDASKKKGCILHILLPYGDDESKPYFYANLGIAKALRECQKFGMSIDKVWAKIIGGACVFSRVDESNGIGIRNVNEVKKWLKLYKIPIIAEDVGGKSGRNLIFNLETGEIEVFTLQKGIIKI
ncbi:MAG: chemotaxis protein CheD [Proteobacteria bacterium]|nr:chemotaxis protein CheD [Pseudomonadota bacterium]